MDTLDFLWGKWVTCIWLHGLLHFGSVANGCRLVREVLRLLGIGMLVLGALSLDVSGDGQNNMLHVVIPIKGDATKQSTFPVHSNFVVLFQRFVEVLGVLDTLALHTKIIHD